jgi:hypothetical protein
MYCATCGKEISNNQSFCRFCGAATGFSTRPLEQSFAEQTKPQASAGIKAAVVAASIILCGALFLVGVDIYKLYNPPPALVANADATPRPVIVVSTPAPTPNEPPPAPKPKRPPPSAVLESETIEGGRYIRVKFARGSNTATIDAPPGQISMGYLVSARTQQQMSVSLTPRTGNPRFGVMYYLLKPS